MSKSYTDESVREVAKLLFGDGADELVSKLSDPEKDHKRRAITAGLSAVGAGAGAAGLALGGHNLRRGYKEARIAQKAENLYHAPRAKRKAIKTAVGGEKLATGLIPLEVAGLGGEVQATRILHGDTKKKKPVAKSEPAQSDLHIPGGSLKKMAAKKIVNETPHLQAKATEVAGKAKQKFGKSFTWEGEFSKVDADKRQVFGWASIVEMGGEPIYDLQGDYIEMDEIEKSAYDYVIKSRKGGDMHRRNIDDTPVHSSDMIESFMVTPEKVAKMGLPEGSLPTGWWVGFQVNDDDAWNLVKSGKRTAFSIHGRGQRTPMDF